VGIVLLGGVIGSRLLPGSSIAQIEGILQSIQNLGTIGIVGFMCVQIIVAISGLLPASLLGIAGGAVYGVTVGFEIAAFSTMIGAFLAFWISRSLLRPTVARFLQGKYKLKNFDAMLARDGWRSVLLLRLSPIMPFALTSYALGLSSITLRDYSVGSLAALPSLFGYVVMGSLATTGLAAISEESGLMKWIFIGVGIIATALFTLRIGKLAMMAGLVPRRVKDRKLID
jgi:uncharacterized membrane protein YdjX (TVP38/TMEM64 family)